MKLKDKQLIAENIVIISGPSGAGEDTIISELSKQIKLEKIITTTTRKKRVGEKNKQDYYFISNQEFKEKIDKGFFVEYACEYNSNYYGVSEKELLRVANSKKQGIWKIEYKGVMTAKKLFPGIKAILINAPLVELENRISKRDTNEKEYLKERMNYTKEWLKHKNIYDYEVINKNNYLNEAVEKVLRYLEKIKNKK